MSFYWKFTVMKDGKIVKKNIISDFIPTIYQVSKESFPLYFLLPFLLSFLQFILVFVLALFLPLCPPTLFSCASSLPTFLLFYASPFCPVFLPCCSFSLWILYLKHNKCKNSCYKLVNCQSACFIFYNKHK